MVHTGFAALEVAEVNLRSLRLRVPEHARQLEDLASVLQPTAREGMAEGMWADSYTADARPHPNALQELVDAVAQQWDAPVPDEDVALMLAVDEAWAVVVQVLPQRTRGGGPEPDLPLLRTLAEHRKVAIVHLFQCQPA